MPMVIPGTTISRFRYAPATTGTKGGLQTSAVEVIIIVSVSIIKIFDNSSCNISEPKITIAI